MLENQNVADWSFEQMAQCGINSVVAMTCAYTLYRSYNRQNKQPSALEKVVLNTTQVLLAWKYVMNENMTDSPTGKFALGCTVLGSIAEYDDVRNKLKFN